MINEIWVRIPSRAPQKGSDMAYCRLSENSDFYVFAHVSGGYACYTSWKMKEDEGIPDRHFPDPASTYQYLLEMKNLGYMVPQRALDRLEKDMTE